MARAGRRVTIHDVAQRRGRQHRHRLEGAERHRPDGAETRERIKRVARRDRLSPERAGPQPAREAQLHRRAADQRHLRPLHAAGDGRHLRGAGRPRRLGLPLRHRGRPGARPDPCRRHARQAGRRHHRHGQAHRPPSAGRSRPICRCRSSTPSPRARPDARHAASPTTRRARAWRSSISARSAAGASPMSPARTSFCVGAASGPAPIARARRATAIAGRTCTASWSEAWGHEAVGRLWSAPARSRTRSSAATTRSRAASSTRCASAGLQCAGRCLRRRLRQLGDRRRRRPARR